MMRRPKEALEQLTTILEELETRPADVVLLVEGKRDRGAMNLLGVWGEIIQVQTSDGILRIAEVGPCIVMGCGLAEKPHGREAVRDGFGWIHAGMAACGARAGIAG